MVDWAIQIPLRQLSDDEARIMPVNDGPDAEVGDRGMNIRSHSASAWETAWPRQQSMERSCKLFNVS